MTVREIMTSDVQTCGPETSLASAAKLMWDTDCGVLPVLNAEGQVMGMITDRDICMACATKNRAPADLTVRDAASSRIYPCKVSDDVHAVMDIMKRKQVRRLPVVDEAGVLQGLISMNDCILLAAETKGGKAAAITCEDVAMALKGISTHRTPVGIR